MLVGFEYIGMTVSNMDCSLNFYCDLLGLELRLRRKAPGAELAFVETTGSQLEIICRDGGAAARAREVPDGETRMRHMTFGFTDVDEIFNRLVKAGVEVQQKSRPAQNSDVSEKVAFVYDPDGIVVELVQRTA